MTIILMVKHHNIDTIHTHTANTHHIIKMRTNLTPKRQREILAHLLLLSLPNYTIINPNNNNNNSASYDQNSINKTADVTDEDVHEHARSERSSVSTRGVNMSYRVQTPIDFTNSTKESNNDRDKLQLQQQ
uniref:Uncharacterized protein n=1 Tax=Lygus hesperus TaxID=30085 RepID=A0A0A9WJQ6_LYGHE